MLRKTIVRMSEGRGGEAFQKRGVKERGRKWERRVRETQKGIMEAKRNPGCKKMGAKKDKIRIKASLQC